MPTPQEEHLLFDPRDVAEMIVRARGIAEGHWTLSVEFGLGAGMMRGQRAENEAPRLSPAAIIPVFRVGIRRGAPTEISVDASKLKGTRKKAGRKPAPRKKPAAAGRGKRKQ